MIVTTSWDDGHVLDLRLAGLLSDAGLAATFYIAPRNRELPPAERLSPRAVQELATRFEIGSHTMTHPVLTEVSHQVAVEEMTSSRAYLSDLIGQSVPSFCYPRGACNRQLADLARTAGYRYARTVSNLRVRAPVDLLLAGTTLETARPALVRSLSHAVRSRRATAMSVVDSLCWSRCAIALFDHARERNGVFHLWGHSWVLEQRGQWDALYRVLDHIRAFGDVRHLTNKQLAAEVSDWPGAAPDQSETSV